MVNKAKSGTFHTVSSGNRSRKGGMFVERSAVSGAFVTRSIDSKVFTGAVESAGKKLSEVSGRFVIRPSKIDTKKR